MGERGEVVGRFFCINFPGNSVCIEMVISHWSRKQTSDIPVFPGKDKAATAQTPSVTLTPNLYLMLVVQPILNVFVQSGKHCCNSMPGREGGKGGGRAGHWRIKYLL